MGRVETIETSKVKRADVQIVVRVFLCRKCHFIVTIFLSSENYDTYIHDQVLQEEEETIGTSRRIKEMLDDPANREFFKVTN